MKKIAYVISIVILAFALSGNAAAYCGKYSSHYRGHTCVKPLCPCG